MLARDAGNTLNNLANKDEVNRIVFLDEVGDRVYYDQQDRYGFSGSMQYKPSNDFSVAFDAFIGSYDSNTNKTDRRQYGEEKLQGRNAAASPASTVARRPKAR